MTTAIRTDTPRPAVGLIPSFLFAVTAALALLIFADGSSGLDGIDMPEVILGTTFLTVVAALTFVSIGRRIQVCFQIALIYFTVYLLLPGFNHASINTFPFYATHYPDAVRTEGALIVGLFCFIMIAVQLASVLSSSRQVTVAKGPTSPARPNAVFLTLVWLLVIASLIFFLGDGGGFQMAFGVRGTETLEGDTAASALMTSLPRTIDAAAFIYALMQIRLIRSRFTKAAVLILFLIPTLILNFPLAIPRSALFGLILSCAIVTVDFKSVTARSLLSLLFVLGAVVAMPVADFLVRGGQSISEIKTSDISSHYFQSGDFDGLQSVNNVVVLRDKEGLQGGRQMLSSALFFVPRSIWPDKALPTGAAAANAVGMKFTNLSEPLPGELFVDFGYLGVIAGGILTAIALMRLDQWINGNWYSLPAARYFAGIFVGYSIPLFRGSLEAVIGPFLLLLLFNYIVYRWGFHRPPQRRSVARRAAASPQRGAAPGTATMARVDDPPP